MGLVYATLIISFIAIFSVNLAWGIINLYVFISEGLQALVVGSTFIENIFLSVYLKWILLIDALWIISALIFAYTRKFYMTDPQLHYLSVNPINEPKVFVIIPAYNEEENVKQVVTDYKNQKFVKEVIIVDNHSSDKTVEIAKSCGATVITSRNEGITEI